jgi:hypothetical protein
MKYEAFVEKTALSPLSGLGNLVENQLATEVWSYFWAVPSIPLIYVCPYARTLP